MDLDNVVPLNRYLKMVESRLFERIREKYTHDYLSEINTMMLRECVLAAAKQLIFHLAVHADRNLLFNIYSVQNGCHSIPVRHLKASRNYSKYSHPAYWVFYGDRKNKQRQFKYFSLSTHSSPDQVELDEFWLKNIIDEARRRELEDFSAQSKSPSISLSRASYEAKKNTIDWELGTINLNNLARFNRYNEALKDVILDGVEFGINFPRALGGGRVKTAGLNLVSFYKSLEGLDGAMICLPMPFCKRIEAAFPMDADVNFSTPRTDIIATIIEQKTNNTSLTKSQLKTEFFTHLSARQFDYYWKQAVEMHPEFSLPGRKKVN